MSFNGLTKAISPKFCILCVRIKINEHSFEPFGVWILFWSASSHSVSDLYVTTILHYYNRKIELVRVIQTHGVVTCTL